MDMGFTKSDDVKEWLLELIRGLREEINRNPDLTDGISNLDWFLKPCQVIVFWFKDPEVKIFIVTHFEDMDDLTIDVLGPCPAYMFFDKAYKLASDLRWDRELSGWDRNFIVGVKTYRDLFELTLVSIRDYLGEAPFLEPDSSNIKKAALSLENKDFIWFIRGNITSINTSKLVREIVNQAKKI